MEGGFLCIAWPTEERLARGARLAQGVYYQAPENCMERASDNAAGLRLTEIAVVRLKANQGEAPARGSGAVICCELARPLVHNSNRSKPPIEQKPQIEHSRN